MSERWSSGVWLGKRLGTEEHMVMKEDGAVVRARAVRELEKNVTLKDYEALTGRLMIHLEHYVLVNEMVLDV